MNLSHQLNRTIVIQAPRDIVFRYFTDAARWAAWWGAGSSIDARPGGRMLIRYPNGIEAAGEVVETSPPDRIVFTFGYASGSPIPPGSSRVTIRLETVAEGTRLHLVHEFAEVATRDAHIQGWRYQLSVFANVAADEVHGHVDHLVDAWFAAWRETDAGARGRALAAIARPDVRMRDRFSCVDGVDELSQHIGASQVFMPGMNLQKSAPARHCQGTVLADWVVVTDAGQRMMSGTNVFVFGPDRLIQAVTGFPAPPAV